MCVCVCDRERKRTFCSFYLLWNFLQCIQIVIFLYIYPEVSLIVILPSTQCNPPFYLLRYNRCSQFFFHFIRVSSVCVMCSGCVLFECLYCIIQFFPCLGGLCLRTSLCKAQGIFCQLKILCQGQSDAKFAGWCLGSCNIFLLVYPVQVTAWPPELSSLYTNWVQGDGGPDTLPLSDCGNKTGKWKELQFQGAGGSITTMLIFGLRYKVKEVGLIMEMWSVRSRCGEFCSVDSAVSVFTYW